MKQPFTTDQPASKCVRHSNELVTVSENPHPAWASSRHAHHRKTKPGESVTASMSSAMISCHVQVAVSPTPGALRAYSSQGGSIRTTSNFVPKVADDKEIFLRSAYTAAGGRVGVRRSCVCSLLHMLTKLRCLQRADKPEIS